MWLLVSFVSEHCEIEKGVPEMREIVAMSLLNETDNKLRWEADVDGVSFKLYIPKWRVPKPWPDMVKVVIDENVFETKAITGQQILAGSLICSIYDHPDAFEPS